MTRRPRRNHGAAFKVNVALEAIKCDQTLSELAEGRSAALALLGESLRRT